jgi:NhaP-type Na+/H+ or K+/H+ antiporter
MSGLSIQELAMVLALIGVVIMVAALVSGLIERSNLPQVAVFLALGAVLGAPGLGLFNITLGSPELQVVATLSLALVLFMDAVNLDVAEMRTHARLAVLVLGPGTLLTAALVTLAGWWLLGLPLAAAAIVGASLASTDPVLLRGFLRRRDISGTARQVLRLESGLNDAVLLPVVLIAMAFLGHRSSPSTGTEWARFVLDLFLLGPATGVAVGLLSVATLDLVRRRIGVRRDYESLYSLGVAFTAFAAAEMVHGSGFLAAFAAGLTISALDVELCDCFLEYGETTAELALLFTFVLFGSSLIWSGLTILSVPALLFAALVLLFRPMAYLLSLAGVRLSRHDRLLISWFGPRGLSTLLLVLLAVFGGIQGSDQLFAICALVVLVSIVLHGGSLMVLTNGRERGRGRGRGRTGQAGPQDREQEQEPEQVGVATDTVGEKGSAERVPQERQREKVKREEEEGMVGVPVQHPDGREREREQALPTITPEAPQFTVDRERITVEEMRRLQGRGELVVVVDARTERTYRNSDALAGGAVRITPDQIGIAEQAERLGVPRHAWVVVFCA